MKLLDSKSYAKASVIAILQLYFSILSEILYSKFNGFSFEILEDIETGEESDEGNNVDETNEDNYDENNEDHEILEYDPDDEDDDALLNGHKFYLNVVFNRSHPHCFFILICIFVFAFLMELIELFEHTFE